MSKIEGVFIRGHLRKVGISSVKSLIYLILVYEMRGKHKQQKPFKSSVPRVKST